MIQFLPKDHIDILPSPIETYEIYPYIKDLYLQGHLPLRQCDAGDCISNATEKDFHIIYILSGGVKIYSMAFSGKNIFLDEVQSPTFCGHISKVRGFNFDSNIIARTPCIFIKFNDKEFHKLMEDTSFALHFYQSTSTRIYHMYRKILSLNIFSIEENAAYYISTHKNHLHGLTLESMSEEIGISRRSLCNLIKKWKEKGIISRDTTGYHINDHEAFSDICKNVSAFYVK